MSLSSKEIEDGENQISEDKDNGSTDEVVIPRKNGRKVTTAPGNKVGGKRSLAPTFAEKLISHHRKGVTWAKLPKDKKSAKLEDPEERNENYEEDEGKNSDLDQEEEDSEKEAWYSTWARGRKALPMGVEEDELDNDDDDKGWEEEEKEELVKKTPDKRKTEMAQQKASPETKKQKLEAEPPVTFRLLVGNLNFNKTAAELKTGLSEFFAKNDLVVVGVRVGLSRRVGYVNFKSAEDQEKALELRDTKVLGYEIKLKKPKGKERKKDQNAKRLLIRNLPDNITQHELKEVFEDAFQIRLVSKDGMSERVAYIDFKSQAEAERVLEEKQGTEIGRLAIVLDRVGEKSQGQEGQDRKHSPWRVGKRRIEQESHTFQEKWERAYFFVEVKSVPTCLICKQSLSVSKEYNLRRHYETHHSRNHDGYTEKMRDKKLNKLKKRLKFQHDLLLNVNKISDAAMKCSYVLSEKIARASKPLTDGEFIKECLLSAAEIMCPEQRPVFANVRLSGNVVGQHIDNMTENLEDKLQEKAKSFVAFSIAAHESADINNTPQLAVFIHGVDEAFDVTEELLDMVPMTSTTSGNELFLCVEKSLKKFNVDWSKLVSVSTDGSSAMVGVKQLVTKLKSQVSRLCKDTELKSVHGLILQESLCANKLKMDHVMDVVIYTITWIHSHGSNHRKFSALFNELDAQYGRLFCSMEPKWLSRGMVLRQFFELLEEIDFFMSSKGKSVPQLTSEDWVKDLAFLVDIMTYLNTLDISLQGRSQVVTQMYDSIRSFLAKLCLWETHLARNSLAHFPTLKLVSENESDGLNYIPKKLL